jgi:hypothetical protein
MRGLSSIVSLTHRYEPKLTVPTTPISTNLRAWFDATDPNGDGSTVANNTSVTYWKDKSSSSINPKYATGYNSSGVVTGITYNTTGLNNNYPAFNFGSTNGTRFKGTLSTDISGTTMRIFMVASVSNAGTYGRAIAFNGVEIIRINGRGLAAYRGNYTRINNDPSAYDIPLIWEFWFDGTYVNNNFLNGDLTTQPKSANNSGSFSISSYSIGGEINTDINNLSTHYFYGKISEILVYRGTMTTGDVQKTEAYLAKKYGLKSTLPTSNPYRNLIQ